MARILITEDERLIAEDLKLTLQEHGHKIVGVVATGEKAVELALQEKPDIIIMDIRLEGELNGIDAAKTIQKKIEVSIIFCSAFGDDNTLLKASVVNPLGYIEKPFEFKEIEILLAKDFSQQEQGNVLNPNGSHPDFDSKKIS